MSRRAAVCVAVVLATGCERSPEVGEPPADSRAAEARATYVGGAVCASCHGEEADRWRGSHHDRALQQADLETVLGDFDDAELTYNGVTTRFFARDGEPWVRTDGPDGALQEYRVTHGIGIEPLQQYLVEFPGGRRQALSIAWDARPAEAGGQRWFHLYPDEAIAAGDPLHWTGTFQNWNTMCAECHSTGLEKNYQFSEDTFETVWASIDVDCEACHGPGSRHVADPVRSTLALGTVERSWTFSDGDPIAALAPGSRRSNEIGVCAQCHARRSQLGDEFVPGQPFLDAFRPALLETGLYHSDGQIADEVYVYGSFLQSAMARAGVTCSDCHEPHGTALRAEGNAVCARCHLPSAFDTSEHHRHAPGGDAPRCVDCHMRAETYMVVDPRRDHSFRVPRPDLSDRLESPNACNDCHADQTAEWAADRIGEWFPGGRHTERHYGEALQAGRAWAADANALLGELIEDTSRPAIARATALSLVSGRLDAASFPIIRDALNDANPLVQLAALDATQSLPVSLRVDYAQRFLTSPLLSHRTAAARSLLAARMELGPGRQRDLDAALEEYAAAQRFNSDRGEGILNRAVLAAERGQLGEAERLYLQALEREPAFAASYVNLADLYRVTGREREAEQVLRRGLVANPDAAALDLSLGLSLVRSGRPDEALVELARAVEKDPDEPYYAYVLGVALNSTGDSRSAIERLRANHERFPGHADTLLGLATILRDAGEARDALVYARRLAALRPADQAARSLVAELEAAVRR